MRLGNQLQKNNLIKIIVVLFITCLTLCGASFAWFMDFAQTDTDITGSSIGRSFARGDGTEESPYVINRPIHLYNLAWLQNGGYFTTKNYFEIDENIENDTLDMAGSLAGYQNETGAIPPIGTESNPFLGVFNGNGKVIKNLWVSSNRGDWQEFPEQVGDFGNGTTGYYQNIGTYIGLFGKIGNEGNNITNNNGEVRNFVLENIEITTHIEGSTVGIIAGYLNGALETVGVKNAKISSPTDNDIATPNNVNSSYVLVGETGASVQKNNLPGGAEGSSLIIDPVEEEQDQISPYNGNDYHEIDNATDNTAFYTGSIARKSYSAKFYKKVTATDDGTWMTKARTVISPTSAQLEALTEGNSTPELYNRISSNNVKSIVINNTLDLVDDETDPNDDFIDIDDLGYSVPPNCIWFKPQNEGTCYVAVGVTNKSQDIVMSVYSYERNETTKIIETETLKEIELRVSKSKGALDNNTIYVIAFYIPDTALGREFVIGKSNTGDNPSSQFLYLILPGAGNTITNDDFNTGAPKLLNVDYANYNGSTYDVITTSPEEYENKKVALALTNASLSTPILVNTNESTNQVDYYGPSGLADNFGDGSVGNQVEDEDSFPVRRKTKD